MNTRYPRAVIDRIVELRLSGSKLEEICTAIKAEFGLSISKGHVCTLATHNGARIGPKILKQTQPCYDRPPFHHRKTRIRCGECRTINYESKHWQGHCYRCALKAKRVLVLT